MEAIIRMRLRRLPLKLLCRQAAGHSATSYQTVQSSISDTGKPICSIRIWVSSSGSISARDPMRREASPLE
jgi:hypothetical protein